jgi:hypothetical protein
MFDMNEVHEWEIEEVNNIEKDRNKCKCFQYHENVRKSLGEHCAIEVRKASV